MIGPGSNKKQSFFLVNQNSFAMTGDSESREHQNRALTVKDRLSLRISFGDEDRSECFCSGRFPT